MLHPRRYISILIALAIAGGLILSCQPSAMPEATATQIALRPIIQQPLTTYTSGPAGTPIPEAPASHSPTPPETAPSRPVPSTPTPTCTATPSATPPVPTDTPTSPATPSPSATPLAPTATRTRVPPTATPSRYRFLPAGPAQPDLSHPCPGCPLAAAYIVGHILDAAGNPLTGVRLVCYNEWHRYPVVASKAGGEYDFAIIQAKTTWYVVVLDQADQPISPEVAVPFDPEETCRYILDWQRVD